MQRESVGELLAVRQTESNKRVWLTARRLLLAMTGLQLLWLAGVWLTGATVRLDKLAALALCTVATGTAVLRLSGATWLQSNEMKGGRWFWWGGTAVILTIGLWYAAQQRVWSFDEEGMFAAAQVVVAGGAGELFNDYVGRSWLGKQHPPLGPLLFGGALAFGGDSLFVARLLTLAFALGLGGLTFVLGRELFDETTGRVAALLLFTFPLIFRLGTAAMVEVPLTFLATLAVWLVIRRAKRPQRWHWPAVALIFAAGMMLKYTMLFVLPVLLALVAFTSSWRRLVRFALALAGAGLVGFAAGWALWARSLVLQAQWQTIAAYAGLVMTDVYGRQLLLETMSNRLPSALGVYHLPLLAAGVWLAWRRQMRADRFLLAWVAVIWLPLMLTLPDHRYFMMTFPALSVLAANGLQKIPNAVRPALLLAWLNLAGALYLFVDWSRAALLFIK